MKDDVKITGEQTVLHRKYRPRKWSEVVGQKEAVEILRDHLNNDSSHAYLLSGPSGTGKTTLARIAASFVRCTHPIEIDGATNTGIDDMRRVQEMTQYKAFGDSDTKVIIIDEAHRISKQAFDSCLKVIEEPPDFVYWFFCTTVPSKIPETVRSRCTPLKLKPVGNADLTRLLAEVIEAEGLKLSKDILSLVVQSAAGSARQALVNLSLCLKAADTKQAAKLLQSAAESEPVRELCQKLLRAEGSWAATMGIVERMSDESPESIRIQILNYMAAVAKNASDDTQACAVLGIMENFATPYESHENLAPLIISLGRVKFTGHD